MRRSKIGWLASLAVAAVCGLVGQAQAVMYQADDGGFENDLAEFGGSRSLVLLQYDAQPGGEVIDSLTFASGRDSGLAADLLLYEDPNDDGNPDDAELLTSVGATTGSSIGQLFTLPITPTAISGSFFVGIEFINTSGDVLSFVAADLSTMGTGSWILRSPNASPYDRNDLANNAAPLTFLDNFGSDPTPGLRANGISSGIPEPVTAGLSLMSLAALGAAATRRK